MADKSFQTSDERIAEMFRSTIAPLDDPDQAFVNRALAARQASQAMAQPANTGVARAPDASAGNMTASTAAPAAPVTPAVQSRPWYETLEPAAADRISRAGKAAESALASAPDTSQYDALQKTVMAERAPIQSRDDKGKVLPQYRTSAGQKVLRGLAGAGRGLLDGGIGGAIGGAIDPRTAGGRGYGDPNGDYYTAEGNRQQKLKVDEQNLGTMAAGLKDRLNQIKDAVQGQKDVATINADAGRIATTAQERATQQQKEQDQASRLRPSKAEQDIAEREAISDKLKLQGDDRKYYLANGKLREPDPMREMALQIASMRLDDQNQGRVDRVQRDAEAQTKKHKDQIQKRIEKVRELYPGAEKTLAPELKEKLAEIERDDYAGMNAIGQSMAGRLKKYGVDISAPQPAPWEQSNLSDEERDRLLNVKPAPAASPNPPASRVPQPPAAAQKQTDFGLAPAGSKEGRTGTLPDGTPVIVRGGRIVRRDG